MRHSPLTFLVIILLASFSLQAQVPSFDWAHTIGPAGTSSAGFNCFNDPSGNVYVTGRFNGTTDFDPGPGIIALTGVGATDAFLLKLDGAGNFAWVKHFGGPADEFGEEITLDGSGNIYLTGIFQGTVDFDPGTGTDNLTTAGSYDIFVVKLNSSGDLIWARKFGGTMQEGVDGITVDNLGNVLMTGAFIGTADFDPGTGTYNLTAPGLQADSFVSKLDASGNFLWAVRFGNTMPQSGRGIKTDPAGNVYSVGDFRGTVDFDPGTPIVNITSAGVFDVYISKLDPSGNYVWTKAIGGLDNEASEWLELDPSGNVYVTGGYNATADFDPSATTFNQTSAGFDDAYILKLDNNGAFVWVKSVGGLGTDYSLAMSMDAAGNIYAAGQFDNTGDFDPGPSTFNLTPDDTDGFLLKLDATGNFVSAQNIVTGAASSYPLGMHVNASGKICTTGFFTTTADFNPGPGVYNLTPLGGNSIFVQHLTSPTIAISLQPTDITVCSGAAATFTTNASGTTNITYRWQFSPTGPPAFADISDGSNYSGTATSSLTISTATGFGAGRYRCRVNGDLAGEALTSDRELIVTAIPTAPVTTPGSGCGPTASITLTATGGTAGQYRWYTAATGGTAIGGAVNGTFTTPTISSTTTYFVSLVNGACEGSRSSVIATISVCAQSPVITAVSGSTQIDGSVDINLAPLISDPDNDLNLSSLSIVVSPLSGAPASIANAVLSINYSGIAFSGTDQLTIRICDLGSNCTQRAVTIEVDGDIIVYNAISPGNGDQLNERWIIRNIEILPDTRQNKVSLFNRWGDEVYSAQDYDNHTRVFKGLSNSGAELGSGTYFYKIEFVSGRTPLTGYITLKR